MGSMRRQALHGPHVSQPAQRGVGAPEASAACRGVELVARQDLGPGSALLLDYGERPLQDMLYHYAFVPLPGPNQTCATSEMFEGFGSCWESLVVTAGLVSANGWAALRACTCLTPAIVVCSD